MSRPCTWKGRLEKRFRWSKLKFEWGRWCYLTDCMGIDRDIFWEWEATNE